MLYDPSDAIDVAFLERFDAPIIIENNKLSTALAEEMRSEADTVEAGLSDGLMGKRQAATPRGGRP